MFCSIHPRDAGNAPAGDGRVAGQGETGRPQHPRNEPRHAVCQHHRRQFAAGEDVVADADFLVNASVQRALVNALVVAAEQHELLLLRQLAGDGG